MNKILFFLIFTSTLLFSNQSILIINSYHKGYEFSDSIITAIEKEFYKNPELDTNILYMDSKRITTKEYLDNLTKLYKVQLKNRKYDLVIAVDRFAYDFTLDNYNNFFKDVPVLTVGIENFSKQKALNAGLKKVSVLIEKRDLISNIRLIEKSIPNIKNLYIINDNSLNALHTEPLIYDAIKNHFKSYNLNYLRANNLKELETKFSQYEPYTGILFIRFYKNIDGHLNKNQEISNFIKNSKIPVFVTDSIFSKKGALGGKIVDLTEFGRESAKMAFDILNGKNSEVKIFENLTYVFDEEKIKEFLIFPSAFVEKYKLVNKSETFYTKYEGFITFVFMISPLLIFLILGLIHNIYMRKKIEKELRQRINFDAVLLNAIESPIFWQDKNEKIIDFNSKFCDMLKMSPKDIKGKKLDSFNLNRNAKKMIKVLEKINKNKNNQFKYVDEHKNKKIYLIKRANYFDAKSKVSGIVTIFTDITKEKEIEKEQERNQQFIIQQSKLAEIGEVFSSIAHQWKSPLVEITTIAQESFYLSDSNLKENESYVNDIMTQVKYMNDTINEFQEFIMPSNKKMQFNALEAINSLLHIVNHNIKYNYINIKIDVEKDTDLNILGFRNEFMQSFLNIINNAKEELIKNDLKNRNINITLYNENNQLIINIEDNAGGISEHNINKIFKSYFTTKKDGHGIGLYMAKMIIEDKMNGQILVDNRKSGACFTIKLGQE